MLLAVDSDENALRTIVLEVSAPVASVALSWMLYALFTGKVCCAWTPVAFVPSPKDHW